MNRKIRNILGYASTTLLGVTLLLASFSKISDLAAFYQELSGLSILPNWSHGMIVLILPGLEISLAIYLLTRIALREALFISCILLLLFLALSVHAAFEGSDSSCACFKLPAPSWMTLQGWEIVVRNCVLVGLGAIAWIGLPVEATS